jgi:hypothetical protein
MAGFTQQLAELDRLFQGKALRLGEQEEDEALGRLHGRMVLFMVGNITTVNITYQKLPSSSNEFQPAPSECNFFRADS